MNFNFYGLPEFVSYSILLGIALALIRQKREIRLRYWLAGWLLILLHAGIFMLLPQSFPFDVLARGNLVLAGQLFILAAYYQGPATIHSSRLISRVGVAGALNLTFAVASAAYAELHPGSQQMAPFYLLTALGAAGTIWLAAADSVEAPWHSRLSIALAGAAYALQAWALHAYGLPSGVFLPAPDAEADHGRRVHPLGPGFPGLLAADPACSGDFRPHRGGNLESAEIPRRRQHDVGAAGRADKPGHPLGGP
ncbi:hypothetical protein [Chromobacterium sphagni]|uniref:hypothetical protein n=1 Tax=Chromobacterium sphagni TaxID=1903179 RepID=UPI001959E464|nr:hypothetical protein [Chromobacterium sphagni]